MSSGPLAGRSVLVTRPTGQGEDLVQLIEKDGGRVIRLPAIELEQRADEDVADQLAGLPQADIIVFVSSNAVRHGVDRLGSQRQAALAAVGPATAAALRDAGRTVDIVPDAGFDSEHLLEHSAFRSVAGRNILIVRGQSGRPLLGDTLSARGARVDYLAVYDRRIAERDEAAISAVRAALAGAEIDFTVVMSVETLEALISLLGDDHASLLRQTTLVTPAARVIQTVRDRLSSTQCILAKDPRANGIVDAIRDFVAAGRNPAEKNQ